MVAPHDILLRGLSLKSEGTRPTILQRTDPDFIPAVLNELSRGDKVSLKNSLAKSRTAGNVLRLFQPVHRTYHLALFQAMCEIPGYPRVDPTHIEAAGMVVRRLNGDGRSEEAWMSDGQTVRGWLKLSDPKQDPDPQFRRPEGTTGTPEVDRRLLALHGIINPLTESIAPLFVAPTEVCASAGKTLLYGLIPLSSDEFSQSPTPPESLNQGQIADLFYDFKANTAGRTPPASARYNVLVRLLVAFHVYVNDDQPQEVRQAAEAVQAAFNQLKMTDAQNSPTLNSVLSQAAASLSDGNAITPPGSWPSINATQSQNVFTGLAGLLKVNVSAISSGERRFDAPGRTYRMRAFLRVRRRKECPSQTFWSDPSEPFTIVPWYESSDSSVPPVQVVLPNPLDRNALKKLKPNVAFGLPKELFNFLQQNDPKGLLAGSPQSGGNYPAFDWICSFNIPTITLCAFIVFNIFLQLFDIIFNWMLFIKVCLPIPKKG